MIRDEDGFSAAVLLVLLAVVALWCLAFADAASVLTARLRAQRAADAAALAAAAEQWPFVGVGREPAAAARRTAEANGAELDACDCPPLGPRALVRVSVPARIRYLTGAPRRAEVSASARLDPARIFEDA